MLRYRNRAKLTVPMCEQKPVTVLVPVEKISGVHMPKSGAMTFIFGKMHLFNLKVSERMPQVKYGFECLKQ